MQNKIDEQVRTIMDNCYKQAVSILKKVRNKLDLVANELIKKETLEGEEFEKLMGRARPVLQARLAIKQANKPALATSAAL
jgi:cell division protease FtsH